MTIKPLLNVHNITSHGIKMKLKSILANIGLFGKRVVVHRVIDLLDTNKTPTCMGQVNNAYGFLTELAVKNRLFVYTNG
jgi:hypothetical protein